MGLVASLGLSGFFLINNLCGLVPIRLLDPIWQLTTIGAALGTAYYPLTSVGMISLLILLRPDSAILSTWLQRLRRYAYIPMIGYLLFIPLQGAALFSQQLIDLVPVNRALAGLSATQVEIRNSRSMDALAAVLAKYPNNPRIPADYKTPLEPFKAQLIEQVESRKLLIRNQSATERRQRVFNDGMTFFKVILLCLLYSTAFAAVAQRDAFRPSVLQGLMMVARETRERRGQQRQQQRIPLQEVREQREHALAIKRIHKLARQRNQRSRPFFSPRRAASLQSMALGVTQALQRLPLVGRWFWRGSSAFEKTLQSADPYLARLVRLEENPSSPSTPDREQEKKK